MNSLIPNIVEESNFSGICSDVLCGSVRKFFHTSNEGDVLEKEAIETTIEYRTKFGKRGNIVDRNGVPFAQTIKKYDFWVNTTDNVDRERVVQLF